MFSKVDLRNWRNDTPSVKAVLRVILGILVISGIAGFAWWITHAERQGIFDVFVVGEKKQEPDADRYEVLAGEAVRWRESLAEDYRKAQTAERRREIEGDARIILELIMPEMMRCWLGTGYDFNGTAEKPGGGKIACGYFVSTVLRDAGFKVNRYKLAQQPSQNILLSFIGSESCLLKVGQDYETYADWVEEMDEGIYLIGLDTHVGFIVNTGEEMHFIHSSGARSIGVVEEGRDDAEVIKRSKWRMLGGFTNDPGVVRVWLAGEKVDVVE